MSLKKHIFSENVLEIKTLVEDKFKDGLKSKFGHSNFPFLVKNISVNKFKRISVNAVFDERNIEEKSEINYGGVKRIRKVKRNQISPFSYERKNCTLKNVGKEEIYRVEESDESHTCGRCRGRKEVTCYGGCSGSGRRRCSTCNGRREVKCSNCNGKVNISCSSCWGSGKRSEGYGKDKRTVSCYSCNGRGSNKCSSCSNGFNTCGTCNGNGEVTCYTCSGYGKVGCSSCSSQGSFTKYFIVRSLVVNQENNLVIEGNNPGEFISKKLISEEFPFQNDFIKYKIAKLSDHHSQLKELFNGLKPNNQQLGTMMYASLDECASLTFEIVVGESTYLGNLKDGNLNIDDSSYDQLFYDVINGIKVDSKFNNLLENKAAFKGNLSGTDILWNTINQYQEFEKILGLPRSKNIFNFLDKNLATNKITELIKLNLIDTTKYFIVLRKKFIKNEIIRQSLFTFFSIYILTRIFGRGGGLEFIGFSNFIQTPLIFLFVAIIWAIIAILRLDKKNDKANKDTVGGITVLGYILVIIGFIITCFNLSSKNDGFEAYLQKKKEEKIAYDTRLTNIENFKKFKENKKILSSIEFESLGLKKTNSSWSEPVISDSMIMIRSSEKVKYQFYIDPEVNYDKIVNSYCSSCGSTCYGHEKISEEKLYLSINYEDFVENAGYYKYWGGIRVSAPGSGGFWDYEVKPYDIRFNVRGYGIDFMKNKLEDYTDNIINTYFTNEDVFLKLFPKTDIVNTYKNQVYYFSSSGDLVSEYKKDRNLSDDTLNLNNKLNINDSVKFIKINDPDGYTNVRAGKSSSTEIIHQIYDENKLFELIDDSENWWKIKVDLEDNETTTGYIYYTKVLKVESYTVDVDKAFFHLQANKDYQNTAYVIRGDQLLCHSEIENNFRNCSYVNSKGDTTNGYIIAKKLK